MGVGKLKMKTKKCHFQGTLNYGYLDGKYKRSEHTYAER